MSTANTMTTRLTDATDSAEGFEGVEPLSARVDPTDDVALLRDWSILAARHFAQMYEQLGIYFASQAQALSSALAVIGRELQRAELQRAELQRAELQRAELQRAERPSTVVALNDDVAQTLRDLVDAYNRDNLPDGCAPWTADELVEYLISARYVETFAARGAETRAMLDACEHGISLYEACDECGRYSDGSDGTTAGDYRAIKKRWRAQLNAD